MGGVADVVGNAFSEVGHAVESVGKIAESAVREVGHAAESVGREIGKIGEAAAQNPIGTIAKVAAVASGQWWALPLVSAVDVVAHGGDIGQAALAAGVSLAASWAGGQIASELAAPATDSVASMATADAANMVAQNIPADQISQVLQQSYGISGNIADSIANASTAGISANTLASSYAGAFGQQLTGVADAFSERLAATAIGNSAANFGAKLVQTGGDVSKALAAGAGAGIGTGFGGMVTNELNIAGANDAIATAAGKVVGGTTAGVVQGQDINKAISSNLVQNIISTSFAQAGSQLKSAWNSVNETATKYNETAQSAQDLLKNEVEPARDAAQAAQDAAAASYKEYKSKSDEFADLVKQYDDAKAAGNTTLANELADKANALIPSLNDATDKYNTDAETYQSALDKFNAGNAKLENTGKQLDELKTTYQQQNDVLTKQTEDLSTAAAKVAELNNPNAVKLFNDTYATGADATTALNTATDYSKLSSTARGAFDRDYTATGDMKSSFDFANKINELDTKSQSAFDVAVKQGLDNTKALEIAPTISSFNTNQQTAYSDAIKQGYGAEAADFISALASFGNKALDTIIPSAQAGELPYVGKTPEGKDLVESVYRQDPETGKWGEYIPDGKGGYSNTGAVLVGTYKAGPTGDKYIVEQTVDENGVPSISRTPYVGETKTTSGGAGAMTPQEEIEYQKQVAAADAAAKSGTQTTPSTSTNVSDTSIPNATDVSGTPIIGSTATPKSTSGSTATGDGTFANTNVGPTIETGNQTTPGTGSGGTGGTGAGGSGSGGTGTGGTGSGGTGTGGTGIGGGSALVGTGGYGTWLAQQGQDQYGGIKNLTPGLTERMDYTLTGMPTIQEASNPTTEVPRFAAGGSSAYDPFGTGSDVSSGLSKSLTPGLTKAQIQYILSGLPGANISVQGHADGGSIEEHNPTFFSEGGLNAIENRYVQGDGDGTSDSVKAMLANGEFVIPADVVSDLGNGSNEAGASILDQFLVAIRQDKHPGSDGKLPKDSKGPLAYLLDAKRKARA